MKGVSHTLWIVIAAVVVLVVALVVITIFGGGMQRFASITEAQGYCTMMGQSVCAVGGAEPPGWRVGFDVAGAERFCFSGDVCGTWENVCDRANKRWNGCGG